MDLTPLEVARFWSRVEVRKAGQCWPWRFGTNDDGYGEYRYSLDNKQSELAHRVAYRIGQGEIPEGLVVRHTCDNPCCCNWQHLLLGTHLDNVNDRIKRDRSAKGEGNGRAKLTEQDVKLIRESPLSARYFAGRYEVDAKTIRDMRAGKTWKHV